MLSIDKDILLRQIYELGQIGQETHNEGRTRIALSSDEKKGRDQVVSWMKELDLDVKIDRIGNIIGILNSNKDNQNKKPLMMGSHIDTVTNAGALDGCYGVLAGLAVIRAYKKANIVPCRSITVVAFTNEEGIRYQPDMMGSLVFSGGLKIDEALNTIGTDGTRLEDELKKIGYAGAVESKEFIPYKYIELHVEQGPVLEASQKDIGVVENLQGISWQKIIIEGKANHAGTTPTKLRFDAGLIAAKINVFLREYTLKNNTTLATIGSQDFFPNVINVIPSKVVLSLDLRDPSEIKLKKVENTLSIFLDHLIEEYNVHISSEYLARFQPVEFNEDLVESIEKETKKLGFTYMRLTSGAGHDAQMISRIAPSAMIFVPSKDGISHNPLEYTTDAQLINGANVLLEVVLKNLD